MSNKIRLIVFLALYTTISVAQSVTPTKKADVFFNEPEIAHKVDSLLSIMTIDEKIGQTVLFTSGWDVTGPTVRDNVMEEIRSGRCGNIFNRHTVAATTKLQEIAVNETRLGIPLLFGYDVIHGHRTIFPISLGESASWDLEAIEEGARVAAREASASGLHWTFAPMVDISRDPRWGRISESAGEDPYLGSLIGAARVRGFQGDNLKDVTTVMACVKHFAAYGASQAGRDYHTVDMSERVLRETYLPPYKAALDAGAASVMTSFNEIDGVPASASTHLYTDILRKEWGFNGFVVTDYLAVNELIPHGVAKDKYQAAKLSINAGIDMDMEGGAFMENLKKLIENGEVTEEKLDEAAGYILAMKFRLGLFEDPFRYSNTKREKKEILSKENKEAAYQMAKKSFVLLKNDNQVLPLKKNQKIAVIGQLANSKRDMLGSWKATGSPKEAGTILKAITKKNGKKNTTFAKGYTFKPLDFDHYDNSGFEQAIKNAKDADVILLVAGEHWSWTGEATSRTNIHLPQIQKDLFQELAKLDKPMVVLMMNGRPIAIGDEVDASDAMLEIWYPGTEGGRAVADVIFGEYNPSGKLPATFPRNVGQIPIYHSMKNTGRPYTPGVSKGKYHSKYLFTKNTPLFQFGFGLSYTTFEYSDIKVSSNKVSANDNVTVSVTVKNTGDYDGAEVVQLYLQDVIGSVTRPVRELKGFKKTFIKKGKSATVEFTLSKDDLSFFRQDMSWGTEPGDFNVFVGGDSDAELKVSFELE